MNCPPLSTTTIIADDARLAAKLSCLLAPAVYAANLAAMGQGAVLANGSAPWPLAPTMLDDNRQTPEPTG